MRTVSTGVGLCVLGVCVLGAAVTKAIPFGQPALAEPQSPQASAMPAPDCVPSSAIWFSRVPKLIRNCRSNNAQSPLVACERVEVADVNGDGVNEHFQIAKDGSQSDTSFYLGSETFSQFRLQLDQVAMKDGYATQSVTFVFVMDQELHNAIKSTVSSSFNTSLLLNMNNIGGGQPAWGQGWRDCDGDGDLDLVFRATSNSGEEQVWFENIGFQKTPAPNPYDLDQDGEVGAGDISVLLLNFD